jgi:hypothetical protein
VGVEGAVSARAGGCGRANCWLFRRKATRCAVRQAEDCAQRSTARLPGELPELKYRARMGESALSAEDVRAAAEVHRELGPDYDDAVVESFLARIDGHVEARVEERLASKATPRRRQIDPARLGKYRAVFAGFVAGTAVMGLPLTLFAWAWLGDAGRGHKPLLWMWVVILAVYGLAAYRLRRR